MVRVDYYYMILLDAISLDGTRSEQGSALSIPANLECESISDESIRILQEISTWLRKATNLVNSKEVSQKSRSHLARLFHSRGGSGSGVSMDGSASTGGFQISESLSQYCEFRKELMRISLAK